MRVEGLPDQDTSATVCQIIKKTVQISAPSGTTGNWSAHVFTSNLVNTMRMYQGARTKGNVVQQAFIAGGTQVLGPQLNEIVQAQYNSDANMVPIEVGPINILTSSTDSMGAYAFPNGTTDVQQTWYASPLPLDVQPGVTGSASKLRVIGMGFELRNTTADLYKQGTFTVSRVPASNRLTVTPCLVNTQDSAVYSDDILASPNTGIWNCVPKTCGKSYVAPPSSISDALAYVGTKQWEAKDGAYVVCTMDPTECPLKYGETVARQIGSAQSFVPAAQLGVTYTKRPLNVWATKDGDWNKTFDNVTSITPEYNNDHPFNVSSVIMTGLSKETTFTLEAKFLVEIAPHRSDPVYGPLAYSCSPSAPHDAACLALYQSIARSMPPGVTVDMNGSGGFWDWIRGAAKTMLPVISGLLPGPLGAAVGAIGHLIPGSSKPAAASKAIATAKKKKTVLVAAKDLRPKVVAKRR